MTKPIQHTWSRNVWGIINPDGNPWTHQTFDTELEATNYLEAQQVSQPMWNLSKHTVERVSVTVRRRK